jgi:hypothetical protein
MRHVMIDLETLGTVPGCVILSIGAVEFLPETGQLGQEFYAVVNTASCEEAFLTISEKTMSWWQSQSAEARAVVDMAAIGGGALADVLNSFNVWLAGIGTAKDLRLYGNGADFDNPILASAYDAVKIKPHAAPYGGRCYRTLKNLHELFGPAFKAHKLEHRSGTHHNALDDAKSQARHLMEIVDTVRESVRHGEGDI